MLGQDGKKTDWKNMPLPTMARGNALDAYFTMKVFQKLEKRISELKMDNLYDKLMVPAVEFFKTMELDGLLISGSKVNELGVLLKDDILNNEDRLYSFKEVDKTLELTSTDDLTRILYSCDKKKNIVEGGFNLYPPITSEKTGAPSTSAEALDILLEQLEEEINRRGLNE
jgi:hypothetical protein